MAESNPDIDLKLQKELVRLRNMERDLRNKLLIAPKYWDSNFKKLAALHARLAVEFTEIVRRSGWPSIAAVGWDGAYAAAELARHCFTQPQFMRDCLPFIEQSYRFGEIAGEWFAQHYDTVMYFEGKPQVYGTYLDWDARKRLSPWKIVDRPRVDRRRGAFLIEKLAVSLKKSRAQARVTKLIPPRDLRGYRESLARFARSVGWRRVE